VFCRERHDLGFMKLVEEESERWRPWMREEDLVCNIM